MTGLTEWWESRDVQPEECNPVREFLDSGSRRVSQKSAGLMPGGLIMLSGRVERMDGGDV